MDLKQQVADLLPLVSALETKVEDLENAPKLDPELDYFFVNDATITVSDGGGGTRFLLWDDEPCVDEGKTVVVHAQVTIDPQQAMMDNN